MLRDQDFNFTIGRGHYVGRGWRAVMALAIVQLPRAALLAAGALATPTMTQLLQVARSSILGTEPLSSARRWGAGEWEPLTSSKRPLH